MADENKPAFYPRVGNIRNKNFKSAQPMPFIDDERAMELPQYSEFIPKLGTVDLSVPTKENRELNRRITQRDADLMRQVQADRSFPEKLAGGLQAGRLMGSALAQSVASIPTAITKGGKAAEEYIAENMYKPTQPLAYEYAGDIGDFLEKLETQYKIPPVLPEAMALQYLTGPATAQAMRTAGKGAEQAGRAIERRMEPVVRGALEQGGLPREMVMAMGANTQSNVIKPKGGNWLRGDVEKALDPLLAQGMINNRNIPYGPEFDLAIRQRIEDLKQAASQPDYKGGAGRVAEHLEREMENPRTNEVALNKWIQSNLTNYVKKEMGTPEDPVRKLAEQGISHLPRDLQNIEMTWTPEELAKTRKRFGFPEEETATNPTAKMWEQMADEMIAPSRATEFGEKARQQNPWLEKLNPYDTVYETMRGMPQALKFDHIVDVLRQDVASGRIRPEQLNKVSMEQAVRRTYEYDQELARKMNEARATSRAELPVYKDYPEGFKWVELNRPGDFAAESDAMGHSVRGYEPPKGHPDWVEGSSDSGSSSYGLGGWEAIKSGDAKVYSLVDAKGEPHVTVEVGKARPTQADIEKQPQEVQDEFTRRFDNWVYGIDYRPSPEEIKRETELLFKDMKIPTNEQIVQIKGKGNAKPKDDYLPFVQDFVKGANWSDVGDLKNTGLYRADPDELGMFIPTDPRLQHMPGRRSEDFHRAKEAGLFGENKYLTRNEWEDILRKQIESESGPLPPLPDEGMKRGGKVSISNNPDTMMLAVNNQKMKNGEPAYAGGKLIAGKGLKAAKPPKVEIPRIAMQFGNDLELNMNEVENLARRYPSVDRINMNYKDVTKRVPELTEAAQKLQAGELDRETYAKLVQALKPVKPYDFVPKPATAEEARGALKEDARDTYGVPSQTLKAGHPVGLRLDIPAYTNKGVWVPTVHEQDSGFGAGKKIGHESVASVLNPEFGMSEKAALSIATGKPKGTIATIKGDWNPTSEADIIAKAKEYLKHPEWRQVGMDPERHSYFYDRETMAPVVNAEEVIQIGPLVLAKNPKFGKPEDFKYAKGGITGAINLGLKAARPVVSDAERALPLRLTRAMPKSADEINAHAERVARQMMGEHVTSGKAGDTKNLAGRSMKESQRVKALEYELEPTKVVPESQVYQPRIGDVNVALGGDFTVSDVMLKNLMGEAVNSKQEGGSRYGLGHMKDKTPLFYASNEVPAQAVQNKVTDLYELFGPERVMGHHMAMGPIATNFAQHFADANLRYTDYSKLTPENMMMFDQLMAKGYEITKKNPKTGEVTTKVVDFPKWPGIANPQAAYEAMRKNSEMRKFYNKVMQTPSITEPLGLPNGLDVRYAITSPDLRDMEVNLTGHGVGELVPYADLTDTARHKTYSKGIPGMYEGHQEVLTPFAISFPDAAQHIISTQRPQDFTGTIQKVFPHQRVDQQFIDEMEQYRRRIKELTGKKKGGAVNKAEGGYLKKPAAYINGDEFVNAAKKYGIKDSMNNLNKIVDLVNKGLSVDDAARQVADSGMHKAAGGAIRGDDLILEERPL